MTKTVDPRDEIVRRNLVRFREEAKLSQAQAGDLSGVPVDAIRRYEGGTTATVPGTVLSALARTYGHSVDDFFMTAPPKAKLEAGDVFFLRTRPGVDIDDALYKKLVDTVEKANAEMTKAKPKR